MWMKDIIDENTMQFKTIQQLEKEYHLKIPLTEYYGLLSAIPKEWKILISKDRINSRDDDRDDYKLIDKIDDCNKPSKMIYKTLIKQKCEPPIEKVIMKG